jgi:hypothetical protein
MEGREVKVLESNMICVLCVTSLLAALCSCSSDGWHQAQFEAMGLSISIPEGATVQKKPNEPRTATVYARDGNEIYTVSTHPRYKVLLDEIRNGAEQPHRLSVGGVTGHLFIPSAGKRFSAIAYIELEPGRPLFVWASPDLDLERFRIVLDSISVINGGSDEGPLHSAENAGELKR